jgi:Cd2+/Zn2+-exporting ATPase
VKKALEPLDAEVLDLKVSVADRTAFIEHWSTLEPTKVVEVLNENRLGASLADRGEVLENAGWSRADILTIAHFSMQTGLFCLGVYLEWSKAPAYAANLAFAACILLSFNLVRKAWAAVLSLRANVELLMAVAMIGSLLQGAVLEAASVGTLVTLMDTVTSAAMSAVDKRLSSSISVPPSTVTIPGGATIPLSELKQGTVFLVRAGDRIPADGIVEKGKGSVDESRITGEAVPVAKDAGDKVFSGAILQSGFLDVKATADADASFEAQILDSVKQAKNTESDTQLIVGKFAAWYTPIVVLVAFLIAVIQWDSKQFLVILVAGCPCALLGAAPFVQAATLAVLAKRHTLLVKDTKTLESLARLQWLGIDKTGTITTGQFQLMNMQTVCSLSKETVHQWAAAIETKDSHPIAQSIVQSYTGCLVSFAGWDGLPEVTKYSRVGRSGVKGVIDGKDVGVGNADFLNAEGVPLEGKAAELSRQWTAEGTVLFVTVGKQVGGVLLIDDALRPSTKNTIAKLTSLGIIPTLLTGDKQSNAERAAAAAGIEMIHASLLPEDKKRLLLDASWGHAKPDLEKGLNSRGPIEVGFIGDGLNDCSALANANVGIVMQEVGSQATVDASSAVLQGDIGQIPAAIIVARRSQTLVLVNIILALSINAAVIAAAATIKIPLWLSVLMDNGTLLAVLANSLWPLCWHVEPCDVDCGCAENLVAKTRSRSNSVSSLVDDLYLPAGGRSSLNFKVKELGSGRV